MLTGVAVFSGIALTANLLALLVAQERTAIAAIRAVGVSRSTVVGIVATPGAWYGILGAVVAVSVTYPAAALLNRLAASVVGFEDLVRVSPPILAAGCLIGVVAGAVSAVIAAWRVAGIEPLDALER
ncbi:MAG: FtsX-like permease family protein [Natrialbaceae archaeon]